MVPPFDLFRVLSTTFVLRIFCFTSMSGANNDFYVHRTPETFGDWIAFRSVRFLRLLADVFFAKRYGPRAVVLETIAAVPGMVGALLQHLRALRLIRDDRGFIRSLEAEAENERMHLLVYVTLAKPSFLERLIIIIAQTVFFTAYFIIYIFSPRTGHRVVGYLEEEAVKSYTEFLHCIDTGIHPNPEAPLIARDYWQLPSEARLRDVVIATRADEIRHRDNNHGFADTLEVAEPVFDASLFFFFVFAVVTGLLGVAFLLQYAFDLVPCILCLIQRFFFFSMGVIALLGLLFAKKESVQRFGVMALMGAAFLGGAVALRQVWLIHFPPELPAPCAAWMGAWGPILLEVFNGGGNCAERGSTLLGLSIPEWSLLSFLFLFLWSFSAWKAMYRISK